MRRRREKSKRTVLRDSEIFPSVTLTRVLSRIPLRFWVWVAGLTGAVSAIYLASTVPGFPTNAGIVLLTALFVIIMGQGLLAHRTRLPQVRSLFLLALIIVVTVGMSAIVASLDATPAVFVPVAFLSILLALFFDMPVAMAGLALVSVMFVTVYGEPVVLPVWFLGGMVGVYGASRISRRTDITRLGLWVGLANLGAALAIGLVMNEARTVLIPQLVWGLGSGVFASILVTVTLPYFETYFGITTDIRLLELADLNHPLLHRLSIEAPGTYHHSLTVATLAEAAARSVGAKPLLSRIGALYHDVGKITRPHFFFENSGGHSRDYHARVSASLSSVIITSHVKDGLEMGRIFRLPEVVLDMISQHHGTGLIAYFYRKALTETKNGEKVEETSFRYPGPRPRTKEAAVVMLADSVEADYRFSTWKSRKEIETRVHQVIENKLSDNQLDEVDLTLRDLRRIEQAFIRVLAGLMHTRARYPEEMLGNGKNKGKRQQYLQRPRS